MKLAKYIACICEGGAEAAIIDVLLSDSLLIFKRSDLIEEKVIRCRNARNFEERYLRKEYDSKITVIRILDSRMENFRLSKAYSHKVDVINVITAPEIEILIIISQGEFEHFKKYHSKPSEFCKSILKIHDVKSYDFVKEYYKDSSKLIYSIRKYFEMANIPKNEYSLFDLLI